MKPAVVIAGVAAAVAVAAGASTIQTAPLVLPTIPGATNPAVTQATIRTTICVRGYTTRIRPAQSVTETLKRKWLRASGYADQKLADYELDHFIALEIGGAASDPNNLWLEPKYNGQSQRADKVENSLHRQVCSGAISLQTAQVDMVAFKQLHG